MKKFNDFIREDLNGALVEPQSKASAEAKRLGLVYIGFGRYENPNTQQVTHIVQDDRLVPYNKAIKTNKFQQNSGDDYGSYTKNLRPSIDQTHSDLSNYYGPENFDQNELTAIETYTSSYQDINNRLTSLPTGIPADQIEAMDSSDTMPQTIASLDSAISKVPAPKDFLVYASLDSSYDTNSISPGQTFQFKSFRSTTLDPNLAMNYSSQKIGSSTRRQSVILQIRVRKDSPGLYVDDYSSTPGEAEFVLPRGSMVKVAAGPNKIVGSNKFTDDMNQEVLFFDAELVKSK